MKDAQPDAKLETALHEALSELPLHRAPKSLVPHVLQTIAMRPWWQRAWWEWPVAAQVGFAVVALLLVAATGGGGWWLNESVTFDPAEAVGQNPTFLGWKEGFATSWAALGAWWHTYGQAWLVPGLVAVAISYLLCLVGGTLLVRIALNRAAPTGRRLSVPRNAARLFFA